MQIHCTRSFVVCILYCIKVEVDMQMSVSHISISIGKIVWQVCFSECPSTKVLVFAFQRDLFSFLFLLCSFAFCFSWKKVSLQLLTLGWLLSSHLNLQKPLMCRSQQSRAKAKAKSERKLFGILILGIQIKVQKMLSICRKCK